MFDIGSSLRDARLRQELDFPELEDRTKVRPKYLRALEDERFDVLPAPTYVKGFLRTYAAALGLDPQPFVDEYNSRFAVGEEEAPVQARRVPPRKKPRAGRESRVAVLALLAIAILTAIVIAAWRFGGPEQETVPGLAQGGAPQTTSPADQRARLAVTAVAGPTYMEVRTGARGARLMYSGTLEKGQRKVFQGERLRIAFTQPRNVAVRLNGNAVTLPSGRGFVVTGQRIVPAS